MATKTEDMAGSYELFHDNFVRYEDPKDVSKRTVFAKGDVVKLSHEEAQRLTAGPLPAFGKPGELKRREADRLQALADSVRAQAEAAEAEAKRFEDAKDAEEAPAPVPAPEVAHNTADVQAVPVVPGTPVEKGDSTAPEAKKAAARRQGS